ncbi:MAG: MBL fold metallo-hydrolase [Planctomycetes bacterium]|nr:MBL fold metallo-hydrolase [Planctomycetota bacterium]
MHRDVFRFLLMILTLAVGRAAGAQTLRLYAVDVGQGSATLIVGPTGTALLVDGGPAGSGWNAGANAPGPVAALFAQLGITQIDAMLLTHYHADHYEGLTELLNHNYIKSGGIVYDRGNIPAPENGFTAGVNAYITAAGSKRTQIHVGDAIDLGGGAAVRCIVRAGAIWNGPTVNTAPSQQLENSNSIGILISYNNLQIWIGGDLTGGGTSDGGQTTVDVETPAASAIGDVDIYISDHHGSPTSSAPGFY